MKTNSVETRVATAKEVDLLISWAKREGWNPGVDDAAMFYAVDQSGFFVTLLEGKPIAGISVVKLNTDHAFLGLYLCKPEHRGKGYGLQTWKTAIDSVGRRSIGLDGVVAQQSNYAQQHFIHSHRNVRFSGKLSRNVFKTSGNKPTIVEASDIHFNALLSYDAAIGGLKRKTYYQAWLKNRTYRHTFLAFQNNAIIGAIGIRQCVNNFKIGPWLADDGCIAEVLLNHACKWSGFESFTVDVPEPNSVAMDMVVQFDLSPIFETARMYRGDKPDMKINNLFGVATLELG